MAGGRDIEKKAMDTLKKKVCVKKVSASVLDIGGRLSRRGRYIGYWEKQAKQDVGLGFVLCQFWPTPQKVADKTIGGSDGHIVKKGLHPLAHCLEAKGCLHLPSSRVRGGKETAWLS